LVRFHYGFHFIGLVPVGDYVGHLIKVFRFPRILRGEGKHEEEVNVGAHVTYIDVVLVIMESFGVELIILLNLYHFVLETSN
jgi:hypothetical protein